MNARICCICGEGGANNHYGTLSCDGCKAFFRRVVRLRLQYVCRSSGDCFVTSFARNRCKKCRYDTCISCGMRPEAVQKERDSIRRHTTLRPRVTIASRDALAVNQGTLHDVICDSSSVFQEGGVLDFSTEYIRPMEPHPVSLPVSIPCNSGPWKMLLNLGDTEMFNYISQNYRELIDWTLNFDAGVIKPETKKSLDTLRSSTCHCHSLPFVQLPFIHEVVVKLLKHEILPFVLSITQCEAFREISLPDQVALLRSFAPFMVMISGLGPSAPLFDTVVLFDGCHRLCRGHDFVPNVWKDTNRGRRFISTYLDQLVQPFRELQPDSIELLLIRIISFWNPDVVSKPSKLVVRKNRLMFLLALETYISKNSVSASWRHGALLIFLRTLETVSEKFRNLILYEHVDHPELDPLVFELFRHDDDTMKLAAPYNSYIAKTISF